MTSADLEELIAPAKNLLGFFEKTVLASYSNEPEKYVIETDSFDGRLTVTNSYYEMLEMTDRADEYLDFHFGYRTLASGDLAIVLWLPGLENAIKHQKRWRGFHLTNPSWTQDSDDRFSKWAMRYLEGSWDVDNGPKHHLAETINIINALTEHIVGVPFYKHALDASVRFPAAENTHCYQDAHKTLYGFLVDGIDKVCLNKLAIHSQKPSNFANDKSIDALKKFFPELKEPSKFAHAMSLVSEQRRIAAHSVRPRAQRFPAFFSFTNDLTLCLEALKEPRVLGVSCWGEPVRYAT